MRTLNEHYREKYGCKVYKLSLDGGMSCQLYPQKLNVLAAEKLAQEKQ